VDDVRLEDVDGDVVVVVLDVVEEDDVAKHLDHVEGEAAAGGEPEHQLLAHRPERLAGIGQVLASFCALFCHSKA
jgi:hypothetical protein